MNATAHMTHQEVRARVIKEKLSDGNVITKSITGNENLYIKKQIDYPNGDKRGGCYGDSVYSDDLACTILIGIHEKRKANGELSYQAKYVWGDLQYEEFFLENHIMTRHYKDGQMTGVDKVTHAERRDANQKFLNQLF